MRLFLWLTALLAACWCGGTDGFAANPVGRPMVPSQQAGAEPSSLSPVLYGRTRFPPLVQVSFLADVDAPMPSASVSTNFKNAGRKYLALSEEKPIVTKGVSAALVGGVGDILSQVLGSYALGARFQWDIMRTLTFMMMGLCFKGPVLHFWYGLLGRLKSTLTAVTLDQTIGVAIIYPLNYLVFEIVSAALSLRAPSLLAVQAKMAASLIPVVLAQYYVWPLAQLLSFKFCPPSLRVLYADGISIFWNCFMCTKMAG